VTERQIDHDSGWATDTGNTRDHNEDNIAVHETAIPAAGKGPAPSFYILSDGAGGMAHGDLASHLATNAVVDYLTAQMNGEAATLDDTHRQWLVAAFQEANRLVRDQQQETDGRFVATLLGAIVIGGESVIGNVGDSRAYVIRNNEMNQITKDHSFPGELLRNGVITEEEAENHDKRHILTRAIGAADEVDGEFFHVSFAPGDSLLLCSDGLTNDLSDEQICNIIQQAKGVNDACHALIEASKEASGDDNISVVLVRFVER